MGCQLHDTCIYKLIYNKLVCNSTTTDEVDALLSRRGESEHDAMRRLKNEFLQSFDGVSVLLRASISQVMSEYKLRDCICYYRCIPLKEKESW